MKTNRLKDGWLYSIIFRRDEAVMRLVIVILTLYTLSLYLEKEKLPEVFGIPFTVFSAILLLTWGLRPLVDEILDLFDKNKQEEESIEND